MKPNVHRMNPKTKPAVQEQLRNKLTGLVGNHLAGPPLGLPLESLLDALFERLHEKTRPEDIFEADRDAPWRQAAGVPMELVDE